MPRLTVSIKDEKMPDVIAAIGSRLFDREAGETDDQYVTRWLEDQVITIHRQKLVDDSRNAIPHDRDVIGVLP